jgi:hypothetical protein
VFSETGFDANPCLHCGLAAEACDGDRMLILLEAYTTPDKTTPEHAILAMQAFRKYAQRPTDERSQEMYNEVIDDIRKPGDGHSIKDVMIAFDVLKRGYDETV